MSDSDSPWVEAARRAAAATAARRSDGRQYAVLRGAPGFMLPPRWNGLWLDLSQLSPMPAPLTEEIGPVATATPTERQEQRGDGAVATVYEVSWGATR